MSIADKIINSLTEAVNVSPKSLDNMTAGTGIKFQDSQGKEFLWTTQEGNTWFLFVDGKLQKHLDLGRLSAELKQQAKRYPLSLRNHREQPSSEINQIMKYSKEMQNRGKLGF